MESLTAGELEVMRILWEGQELKPAEIQERYPRAIKNAALRFQLKVLLAKGHVARRKVGKAFYYKAVTRRKRAFRHMARRMAEAFCGGSATGLIAELIESERLSAEDIRQLREFAKGAPAGDKRTTKGAKR